jgi:hypothetical protein
MKGAIGFFAIALGTAAIGLPMAYKYISASASPAHTPGPQAANGLECRVEEYMNEFNSLNSKNTASTTNYVVQIEFLPDNEFRAVDYTAINDVMANDYIGKLVTTDTTYSFQDLKNSSSSNVPSFISFTVNRLTTKLDGYFHGDTLTIIHSGWCTPAYVPPRSIPNKL